MATSTDNTILGDTDATAASETYPKPENEPIILTGIRRPRKQDAMSPLRYPGSKRKMLPAIHELILTSASRPSLFVEPFCGGASIALGLLEMDAVDHILLADLDPLISAFWHEATTAADRLIDDMMREPVTVERWDQWRQASPTCSRGRAMKCLFLNRTNFSGIIGGSAGPIGGRSQVSKYKIDCRFEKESLARRIHNIKRFADEGRIATVLGCSWQETLRFVRSNDKMWSPNDTLLYFDPPYIQKAHRLYTHLFSSGDHKTLANCLMSGLPYRWILSYDREPLVFDLYRNMPGVYEYHVSHHYTMRGNRFGPDPGREVLYANFRPIRSYSCLEAERLHTDEHRFDADQ